MDIKKLSNLYEQDKNFPLIKEANKHLTFIHQGPLGIILDYCKVAYHYKGKLNEQFGITYFRYETKIYPTIRDVKEEVNKMLLIHPMYHQMKFYQYFSSASRRYVDVDQVEMLINSTKIEYIDF